ncbi:hypothetical protein [Brucella sp. 22210]|uniref:hypothetical protein n=1 Tax=Brucella sp. 22210 TaxID=3453892 RepID=UPI003F841353
MTIPEKIDSAEGISYLLKWAAAHDILLGAVYKDLAEKYGVDASAVRFQGARALAATGMYKQVRAR